MHIGYTEHVHDVNYYMAGKLILWPVKYNPAGHGGRPQKCLAETLMGRCVLTQGIQGKNKFNFPIYGSRVTGPEACRTKVGRYSATMRPSVVIIFRFIRKIIMYVLSEV